MKYSFDELRRNKASTYDELIKKEAALLMYYFHSAYCRGNSTFDYVPRHPNISMDDCADYVNNKLEEDGSNIRIVRNGVTSYTMEKVNE